MMNRTKIEPANDESIARAAEALTRGELVGIPTETVYGLAANALDPVAVQKIYVAKGRPSTNPLIVHLASPQQASLVIAQPLEPIVQARFEKLQSLWPGPLTVVLPHNGRVPEIVTAGRSTVAIRVPSHEVTRRLIERCGFPIAAPSANRSTYVSPTRAEHVADGLGEHVTMILDGGRCDCGLESTIVMLTPEATRLLRPGTMTKETLESLLGEVIVTAANENAPELLAPGMMREHYSPQTPVRFVDQANGSSSNDAVAFIAFSRHAANTHRFAKSIVLSEEGDLSIVARDLFATLRQLDTQGLACIYVDRCEPEGIGRAIMDRLSRATAKHNPESR